MFSFSRSIRIFNFTPMRQNSHLVGYGIRLRSYQIECAIWENWRATSPFWTRRVPTCGWFLFLLFPFLDLLLLWQTSKIADAPILSFFSRYVSYQSRECANSLKSRMRRCADPPMRRCADAPILSFPRSIRILCMTRMRRYANAPMRRYSHFLIDTYLMHDANAPNLSFNLVWTQPYRCLSFS